MPQALKRQCNKCKAIVSGQCPNCKRGWADKSRGTRHERGYDWDWVRLREYFMANHPLCEDCLDRGVSVVSTECHHVESIARKPELRLDASNLRALCGECHRRRTSERAAT